jgi:glucan phosphoethanolaminetransferase (alkaline phosphatase superfamily)
MKSLRITSWTLIGASFIFKLMHYPFSGPLILLGVILLLIYTIIFLANNVKENLAESLFHLNILIWTAYFMFRFMYWPFAQAVFAVAVCTALAYIILLRTNKTTISVRHILLFTYMSALIVLSYTPSYRIYYFFNLNTVLNENTNQYNYRAWDKYSWFLYVAEQKQEALDANQKARHAVEESLKRDPSDPEATLFVPYIMRHTYNIQEENWTNYTQP